MTKIKYYFGRLFSMNYKQMLEIVNLVHQRSGKNRIFLFFDMIVCSMKYLAGYMDYYVFHFEELNGKQRSTYITRGINNAYIRKLNDRAYYEVFDNKVLFNKRFQKYLKRDYLDLNEASFDDFAAYVKKHDTFIVKPIDATCGKGVEKITCKKNTNVKKLYQTLKDNNQLLVEDFVIQHKDLSKLFPHSVNTIRLVTANVNGKVTVLFRSIRIGNGKNVVDNFNHGGMYTVMDEKGILTKPAIDKKGNIYEVHPVTKTKIVGFQIPMFEDAIKFVIKAAKEVKEIGLVGWDVCITENGPVMIEGNHMPGHDIYQSKIHLKEDKTGLKPDFDQVIYGEENGYKS